MENAQGKARYRDMTQGPEWKCILLFTLPIMLAQLLQQLYATVDGIVVGNFGSNGGLAAVGNCAIVANVFISISNGMGNGSAILVSQMFGARRRDEMRRAASTAVFLMLVLGLASAILVFAAARPIVLHILGISEEAVIASAVIYLRIYAVGFIFIFLYNIIAAILRAVGDSRALIYFLLVSAVMNVFLDLLFVAAFRWDVAGAAAATVIAQLACVTVSIIYMFRNYPDFRFRLREIRPQRRELALCLKMGLPSTLQQLVVSCGYLLLQRLINSFGQVTMDAWTVGHRYDQYCCIPSLAMMQAMSSFSGQNTGAGRYDRIRRGLRAAIALDLVMVIVIGALLYFLAEPLSMLFNLNDAALAQAVECLHFLPFAYLLFATYIPFNGMFQGCGDPSASAFASLMALFLRVVSSYLLVYCFSGTYNVVWRTYVLGWGAALIFVVVHYLRGTWQNKSLIKNEAPGSKAEPEAED